MKSEAESKDKDLGDLCVWFNASTDKETFLSSPPQSCLMKKCDGYNTECLVYVPRKNYEQDSGGLVNDWIRILKRRDR